MKMSETKYKSIDDNGHKWEIGIKEIGETRRLMSYIKLDEEEFCLSRFNTRSSANEWWNVFKRLLNQGIKK